MPKMNDERFERIKVIIEKLGGQAKAYEIELVKALEYERDRWAKLAADLEELTPGGSEFHGEPFKCVEHLKGHHKTLVEQAKRIKRLEERNETLKWALREIGVDVQSTAGFLRRMPESGWVGECLGMMERSEGLAKSMLSPDEGNQCVCANCKKRFVPDFGAVPRDPSDGRIARCPFCGSDATGPTVVEGR